MMRKIELFFALIGWVMLPSISFGYSGGDGTAGNPYQISSVANWQELMGDSGNWNKHFVLTADIDLAGVAITPIGNNSIKFTGIFDGNSHTIRNVTIIMPANDYIGLFGYVGYKAQIYDLGIIDVNIQGRNYVGGLAGYNFLASIHSCHATGSVTGTSKVGILAGNNYYATINASYTTGIVNGASSLGGLVGSNEGTIRCCYSTATVTGTGNYVGGLAGTNSELVTCYATGSVTGNSYVGGLVGYQSSSNDIRQCFSVGAVSGTSNVGGLVGYKAIGNVINSFWDTQTSGQTTSAGGTGKTTSQMQDSNTFLSAGWDFVDEIANGLHNYWQIEVNNYPHLTLDLWTLSGDGTAAGPYEIAGGVDLGRVFLRPWAHYRLVNHLDLSGVTWSSAVVPVFTGVLDGRGFVISNLTISQNGYNYIGLFGKVNGGQIQNLGVENINIQGDYFVGGLAGANENGLISFCYTTGTVTGGWYVGGLIGESYSGSITSCHVAGTVTGSHDFVGGLTGTNYSPTVLCYTTGYVAGRSGVGGLVGHNGSPPGEDPIVQDLSIMANDELPYLISQCFSTCDISGGSGVGGLVGENNYDGSITSCYAAGSVSGNEGSSGGFCGYQYGRYAIMTDSFWDINTSGMAVGYNLDLDDPGTVTNVLGKSTAEMKTLSTFTNAGWDFTNETANGTNDIWRMCADGVDYPRLNWESIDGDFQCPDGVSMEDLEYFVGRWLLNNCTSSNNYCGGGDVNSSGVVNIADFSIVAEHWLEM